MNTTAESREVPLPPGADYVDDWEKVDESRMPYRFTGTTNFTCNRVNVWTAVTQYADGSIQEPAVVINDEPVPNDKVRELIAVLQKSLALVEGWAALSDPEGTIES
jgi:hypothetical protein